MEQEQEQRTKVAIVGFTPSRLEAPWNDPEFEIWGLNGLYQYKDCPRFDRWFDIHPNSVIKPERIKAYSQMSIPVYLIEPHPDVPTSVAYPRDKVVEALGRSYWTNSISWMVGLALCENFREIHVYGVDMAQDEEYRHQRPNLEYWMGKAEGMGRKIYVPLTSDLLKATHEYGFGHDSGLRKKMREKFDIAQNRATAIDRRVEQLSKERLVLQGVMNNTSWFLQSMGVADHTSMVPSHPDAEENEA